MAKKTRKEETVSLMPMPGFEPRPDGNTKGNPGVPVSGPARARKLDFEGMIGAGENVTGFEAQTANGTARAGDHPGYNQESKYTMPEAQKRGPWARGNRSGE